MSRRSFDDLYQKIVKPMLRKPMWSLDRAVKRLKLRARSLDVGLYR
jgi:hypothetical protein